MGTITETESNGADVSVGEALTNAELTAEVRRLQKQLRDLGVRLWGDEELRAKWAEAKRLHVTPNIPEPPKGHLDLIEQIAGGIADKQHYLETLLKKLEEHMKFVDRVGAWIGPLMDDAEFQPPFNGAQMASKRYVDDAASRLSAALRDEWREPLHFFREVYALFASVSSVFSNNRHMTPADRQQNRLDVITEIAERLLKAWSYVDDKLAEEGRPRGLERLRWAVKFAMTGQAPKR